MRVFSRAALIALALFACVIPSPALAKPSGLDAYEVKITPKSLKTLAERGFDVTEGRHGGTIEIIATASQARAVTKAGAAARLKRDAQGRTALQRAQRMARPDGSYDVYRPYFDHTYVGTVNADGTGGPRQTLFEEMQALAASRPDIVKPEIVGYSEYRHTPILALKVTKDARSTPDGQRPAVLYNATQHAREWITPESIRRLSHLFVDNYTNPTDTSEAKAHDGADLNGEADALTKGELTRLINTNELWFLIVANPDGYDWTFTPGNRLWRKNLHDNNGDGQITSVDGVDPNRNFPTHWGYDNEGSSPDPSSETYRGTGPASEAETKAMDGLVKRVGFEEQVNYHSAAELLLYPLGFQQSTYSADDPIFRALSGTDDDPAIKGQAPGAPDFYDPDVSAELYITNGDTVDHVYGKYDTLAWTPEMDVSDPARGGGDSVFEFQDSEADLQDAFEKNVPFVLDVARSAKDPANPVTHLGNDVPDFELKPFNVSYGDPQTVEVNAKRELGNVTLHWRVNNGDEQSAPTKEFKGGEVYGGEGDVYFHRMRGEVKGTKPGDDVKVWFEAGGRRSQSFTYSVASDTGAQVLIMAAEDYSGKPNTQDPEQPAGDGPAFLSYYTQALQANGIAYDVYDVDARGRTAPDALGVLSHYKAVVWYTGNDFFVREPGAPGGTGTSKLALDEIVAVRDFLNEGGKLLYSGQNAATGQLTAFPYNANGQPPYCDVAEVEDPPNSDPNLIPVERCASLNDDFLQYWLGAYLHINAANDPDGAGALGFQNVGDPFGTTAFKLNGPESADNQNHVYSMVTTSSILTPDKFPQFKSQVATAFQRKPAFDPPTGSHYMYAASNDNAWQRLRKTIDLTGANTGSLKFQISYDTEDQYDFVVVEAHTVGQDDWTTLEEKSGGTEANVGESCDINWDTLHPFLTHYQTNTSKVQPPPSSVKDCTPQGTTGSPPGQWFGATGNSGGFHNWEFDLSAYKGKQIEVAISYIQDFASAGLGVFVDDAVVTKDGAESESTSFEDDLGGWTAGPAAAGSENDGQWARRTSVGFKEGPGVATKRTLYYGFGLEGIAGADKRSAFMADAMRYLGVLRGGGPGGGGGTPPPGGGTPPPGGTSPDYRLRLSKSRLRVDRKRRTKVRLACGPTKGGLCKGVVTLRRGTRTVMGRRSFTTRAGKTRSITVRISKSAYRRLTRTKRIRTTITLVSRGSDGVLRKKSQRVTMVRAKAQKAKKKKR